MSLDRRANMTDQAHPAIYICLVLRRRALGSGSTPRVLPVGGRGARSSRLEHSAVRISAPPARPRNQLATELGKRQVAARSLFTLSSVHEQYRCCRGY